MTGAASGIGLATAKAFAAEGARVAVADRNLPGAVKVAAKCNFILAFHFILMFISTSPAD